MFAAIVGSFATVAFLSGPWENLSWLAVVIVWFMGRRYSRYSRLEATRLHLRRALLLAMGGGVDVTLKCECGAEHTVDASVADDETREERLKAAEEWSKDHGAGRGHGISFELPEVARGGPASRRDT
jgi:hypothetical protein